MDWIKNNKNIIFKIFSIILYAGAMLIYEFLFCNGALIIGEGTNFNFSFVRLVIYIALGFVYIKFINQSTEEAIKSLKSKGKIGLIALVCIAFAIVIAYFIYKQVYFYKIILTIITLIMSVIALLYLSNNHIKNILIMFMTLGILFCCTTQLNGSLDEKRHFMSAFNISVGNLNYKKNNISEESIEKIPRVCPLNESMKFFGEKYENKKFENNDTDVDQKPSNYNFIIYLPSAIGISLAKILGGSIADIYIVGRIFNLLAYMLLLMAIIKLLPFKKNVFFVSYLLPIIILLAGSYSIDGMCIGIVGLFIAYCLKLYKDPQEIKAKQIFKLAILFALSLLAKEMSYLFICLLILMMPLGKIIKENKKPMIIATIGVILVMLVLVKSIFFRRRSCTGK